MKLWLGEHTLQCTDAGWFRCYCGELYWTTNHDNATKQHKLHLCKVEASGNYLED